MRLMVLAISNKIRLFLGILFALILCQSTLSAQISAPTSSYSSITEYSVGGTQDEIFVFCDEAGVNIGELKAVAPDAIPGWNFTWTKWNSGSASFDTPFNTANGTESTVNALGDGLYHVKIEKGTEVRDYQTWVINHIEIANKPTIVFDKKNCAGVYFKSTYAPIDYKYNNYPNVDELIVSQPNPNPLTFVLKRGALEVGRASIPDYKGGDVNLLDDDAFENTASYIVTVIDRCGFEFDSDPVDDISTYVVDAIFSFDPATGEAPLEVNFKLDNKNPLGAEYQWSFYKDSKQIPEVDYDVTAEQEDLLTDIVIKEDPVYTYMHPGNYFVKLIVTNNDAPDACEDIFTSTEIIVEGSIFEVPNVFTPNGDGKNDKFHLKLYSVKSYSVKIFNRWGRMVYEFQESDVSPGLADRKSSKGWDGKINGKLAASGTYFYVIEAEGREEEGKHYTEKGSLTLLHNK